MTLCEEYQQKFYENLGDREYDCFQESEEKYLKLKIGYNLFGMPEVDDTFNNLNGNYTIVELYNKKQNEIINNIHSVIKSQSVYNEERDQVIVSFMFNCCEFMDKKILKRRNSNEDVKVGCFPVFRIRKCCGSPDNKNCCVYVDEHGRVYEDWKDYLNNNKIPKAKMYVPKNGKYQGNHNDVVQLEVLLSPACSVKENALKVADISSTAASLISGGIAVGAMIPAVTVAPVVLTGALLTGAGVGLYSVVRSSLVLHDRKTHRQSNHLKNKEARNCYMNIVTGATSVITTGATKAATIALNRGVAIGEGAATALMSVNALNLTVNGCNLANSIYSIAYDIRNKKNPSAIDVLHLTTTFLFFGNAVVNFKSACLIYKDARSVSFADMVQKQSQNLWTRAKNQFFRTDMTKTDNTSSVKVINDSGDYCSNFMNIPFRERATDLCKNASSNLLENSIRSIDLNSLVEFGRIIIENQDNVYAMCRIILSRFEFTIQETLLNVFKYFLADVIQASFDVLSQIFPKKEKIVILLNFMINFIKFKVTESEINYQQRKSEEMKTLNISEKEYDANVGFQNTAERMMHFFKTTLLKMVCSSGRPEEILFREMVRFFWEWLNDKAYEHTLKISQQPNDHEIERCRKFVNCGKCGGYYYDD